MKIFMLLSIATLALNLEAMTVTRPKAKPKPDVAAACASQTEPLVVVVRALNAPAANTCEPVELELSALPAHTEAPPSAPSPVHAQAPVREPIATFPVVSVVHAGAAAPQSLYPVLPPKEMHHGLAAAAASQALVVVDLAADSKQAREKLQLVIPYKLQEKAILMSLIRTKIALLYPKWPVQIYPDLLEEEATYQLGQCSRKAEQEIILSPTRHWLLESFCQCIPLFNSKKQVIVQLQRKNPSIEESDIDAEFKKIISALLKQRIDALYLKILKKPRPDFWDNDYNDIENFYNKIKALPDPKDKLLLEETVDIVWEEKPIPAPAARALEKSAKKSSCVIC